MAVSGRRTWLLRVPRLCYGASHVGERRLLIGSARQVVIVRLFALKSALDTFVSGILFVGFHGLLGVGAVCYFALAPFRLIRRSMESSG
jgi:hypothetical protein